MLLRRASAVDERKDNEFKPFFLSRFDSDRGEWGRNLITLEEYFQHLARTKAMVICVRELDNSLTELFEECRVYRVRVLID